MQKTAEEGRLSTEKGSLPAEERAQSEEVVGGEFALVPERLGLAYFVSWWISTSVGVVLGKNRSMPKMLTKGRNMLTILPLR